MKYQKASNVFQKHRRFVCMTDPSSVSGKRLPTVFFTLKKGHTTETFVFQKQFDTF